MAANASLSTTSFRTEAFRRDAEYRRDAESRRDESSYCEEESHEMTYVGACLFAVLLCFGGQLAQWELSYLGLWPRSVEQVENASDSETNADRTTLESVYGSRNESLASHRR